MLTSRSKVESSPVFWQYLVKQKQLINTEGKKRIPTKFRFIVWLTWCLQDLKSDSKSHQNNHPSCPMQIWTRLTEQDRGFAPPYLHFPLFSTWSSEARTLISVFTAEALALSLFTLWSFRRKRFLHISHLQPCLLAEPFWFSELDGGGADDRAGAGDRQWHVWVTDSDMYVCWWSDCWQKWVSSSDLNKCSRTCTIRRNWWRCKCHPS